MNYKCQNEFQYLFPYEVFNLSQSDYPQGHRPIRRLKTCLCQIKLNTVFANHFLPFIVTFSKIESLLRATSMFQTSCLWRMLETKCAGDKFEMLVTVLSLLVTVLSPTSTCHHLCSLIGWSLLVLPDFGRIFWFVIQFKNCAVFVCFQLEFCMFSRNWLFKFFNYFDTKIPYHGMSHKIWVICMTHKFEKLALSSLNLTTMTSLPTAIGALAGRLIWYVLFNLTGNFKLPSQLSNQINILSLCWLRWFIFFLSIFWVMSHWWEWLIFSKKGKINNF